MKASDLVNIDPYLKPFVRQLEKRKQLSHLRKLEFTDGKHLLKEVINNHLYYGLHLENGHWVFREKAPNARRMFLYGDFSAWQIDERFELQHINEDDWEVQIPENLLRHGMLYKIWMMWDGGADERLPAYATRVVQDDKSKIFSAQVWNPERPFVWLNNNPKRKGYYYIYEAHIGMSSVEPKVSSYIEFRDSVLPRVKKLGYNAIQLMAIQEHPYYGSFGYQVANFFAPSSRFGTPEELKSLVDTAHEMGIAVIMDIVHSHAVSNPKEGLSLFDGNDHLYFHTGEQGHHPVWDSRLFDYGKPETLSFLLSNVKYWLEDFRFDGLRFDGVTSMCYFNHGIGVDFVKYDQYFDNNVDLDAITYLTLANEMVKEVNEDAITIAEDVSGMPGMASPIEQGGIGFNYRMSMGIADFWTKTIKKYKDEEWNVGEIFFRLTDKRPEERTISYAESHDQAMVGDKTIIFQLLDKEMYNAMSIDTPNLIVDRGMALHKIIRLLTAALSDGGYLNFMGNEFGHPEWIDFPREGNQWSYQHARRRWDLADVS
ncbi:1,4-alpha-glucan-branching enzyme, partial [Bacteroidales bacterium OttesenSCG-928-C03]|nr:1,4-alpha-glucan-branching enzyme [Bacteroidales bacterium OttesenSCG-928-C03]